MRSYSASEVKTELRADTAGVIRTDPHQLRPADVGFFRGLFFLSGKGTPEHMRAI